MSGLANLRGLTTYEAAGFDRIVGEWVGWWVNQIDAVEDWDREGLTMGQRAWRLVLNDPYSSALLRFFLSNVLGGGLPWQSHYQLDPDGVATPGELRARRALTRLVREHSSGWRLDPACILTRRRLELQIVASGVVAGDGFGVRGWWPGRPGCDGYNTTWRPMDAARVGNPGGCGNDPGRLYDGIEVKYGRPYALHWYDPRAKTWEATKWWADDGTRNVIHYAPDRTRAGGLRGFSLYAPILKLALHMARVAEAHVLAKRIQASHPMYIQSSDPKKSAEIHRNNALRGSNSVVEAATIAYIGNDAKVTMPTFSYQGTDFKEFATTQLTAFCASWGFPWQGVLCQWTEGNLATSQAALDQIDKVASDYQDDVESEVCQPIDDSIRREAIARGRIELLATDWERIGAGVYDRPRRADANRLRTRQAAAEALTLGVAPSTVHQEMGYNFEEEVRRTATDIAMAHANGVTIQAMIPKAPPGGSPPGQPIELDDEAPPAPGQPTPAKATP